LTLLPKGYLEEAMKLALGALAGLLLAGLSWAQPAAAQGLPQGSYMRSCASVSMRGDSLVAYCRRPDGYSQWTWINEVNRCVGDIANHEGNLMCRYGAAQAAPPPYRAPPAAGPYGAPPAAPPYGAPPPAAAAPYGPPGYGSERQARCEALRREAEDLRARLAREFNPLERARIEGRLQEMREREERCR
jgi:hypothetical protein